MQEFKIEGDTLKREARLSKLSWGAVFLLLGISVLLVALRISRYIAGPGLDGLFVVLVLGAALLALFMAPREGLRRAERKMLFVLDDEGIVRKRKGYPDVRIAFSEVDTVGEELRWLVIYSFEPRRKIAVPNSVRGYEVIRAEFAKHHPLAAPAGVPLKHLALPALPILSCAALLFYSDKRVLIPAAVIWIASLAVTSQRLWFLKRRGFSYVRAYLGLAWFAAILLVYFRVLRS